MPKQVVIVHGWSDSSKSFEKLRHFLAGNGFDVVQIRLADYISLDDDVRIEDVAKRMQAVLREEIIANRLQAPFDLVVHSTGGLLAREWVTRFYPAGVQCPVKRLVMLAPANFGSALAHLGKSMIGRLTKGLSNRLQTGTEMLNSLELASPYQWNLACRDLLDPSGDTDVGPYGADRVMPFVIVGSRAYASGLRRIVNENGSDGTVRAAAANLNAVGMTVDFTADPKEPVVRPWARRCGPIPFAVLPDRDHGMITRPADNPGSKPHISAQLGALILEALGCDGASAYAAINLKWAGISEATADLVDDPAALGAAFDDDPPESAAFHQYFHIVTSVRDDHGRPVDDYFLEFFPPQKRSEEPVVYFHKEVLENVHVNGQAPSLRALYADRNDLMDNYYKKRIREVEKREVAVTISVAEVGPNIRFFDRTRIGASGSFLVHNESHEERKDLPARLYRNTTHLVEIVVPRHGIDKVFRLST